MSGNDELGDMIAELTKLREEHEALKAKVREFIDHHKITTNAYGDGYGLIKAKLFKELEEMVK